MYKPLLCAAALVAAISTNLVGDPATKAAQPPVVVIKDYAFSPSRLTVEPGTTVTWVNEDESPHTIADDEGTFRSAALDVNERFSHTFTQLGAFTYHCSMHPAMVGEIVVRPAGG
jgi:plastocyanin